MTKYSGVAGRIQVALEDAYGTTGTTWTTVGYMSTSALDDTNNVVEIPAVGHRTIQESVAGKYGLAGSFNYTVQDGAFLYFLLGQYDATSPVSDDPAVGVNKHYITQKDTGNLPSFSAHMGVETGGTDLVLDAIGCKASSQSFSWNLDSPMTSTVNFVGKTVDISDATAESVTESTAPVQMMGMKGAVINLNSVDESSTVTSLDFTITNTLSPRYSFNNRLLTDLLCPEQKIAGNITMDFEDFDQYELFLSDTVDATAPVETGDVKEFDSYVMCANEESGSETASYEGVKLELKNMRFNTHSHKIDLGEPVTQTFGFVCEEMNAYYYDSSGSDVFA